MKRIIFVLIVMIISFKPAVYIDASEKKPVKIAIIPFDIHSEKDLSFLQKGIQNMLTTRLARGGEVELISEAKTKVAIAGFSKPLTSQTAHVLGAKLSADYVVFGSLTVFGNMVSTDASLIDVRGNRQVVAFNKSGENQGDVISHINLFAGNINETLFGKMPEPVEKPEESQKKESTITASDEPDFFKSRKFKTEIMSMAIGDVDGDGRAETVFVSSSDIFIFRHIKGRFVKVAEMKEKSYNDFIRVDIADINKNKKAEIFITNLSRTSTLLNSFVLEWDGKEFKKIVKKQNLHFRIINTPERGTILLGQKSDTQEIFEKNLYELEWTGGGYEPNVRHNPPKKKNIYNFTYGDPFHTDQQVITCFSKNDRIRVLDKAGKLEWESEDKYGGSYSHIEYSNSGNDDKGRYYLHQRIIVTDFEKDGKDYIIVVKNQDSTSRVLAKFRMFRRGNIECLAWNGVGFERKWKTQDISGYISDYTVGDIDNDGRNELVCAVVVKGDSFVEKKRSYFIIWNKISNNPGGVGEVDVN